MPVFYQQTVEDESKSIASHGKVVIPLFDLPYEEKFIQICGGKSGRGSLIIRRRNFSQTYLKFYRS